MDEEKIKIIKEFYKLLLGEKKEKPEDFYTDNLERFLNNQDFDTIKFIQAVMYIGRDKILETDSDPKIILENELDRLEFTKDKSIEIGQILQKCPLDIYLKKGFKILGID